MQTGFDKHQDRQIELEDEQRKATLKTLQEDAETPQDKVAAIQAVYHRDPGVLKQHVENLTRRLTGKQPQPVVNPKDAQASRLAPIVAKGVTPEQQRQKGNIDTFTQEGEIGNQQARAAEQKKQADTFALIDQYITDPEQNKTAKEDYVKRQAGATNTIKNIPGAGGQPYKTPNGTYVRPVQNADGSIVEQPMPAGWAPPEPKAPPMKSGTVNGKNAFAYYSMSKGGWIDSNTGQPVHNFIPAPTFSQTGLYGLDTGYDGQGNPVPMLLNRRTGQMTPAPAGLVAPAQAKGIEGQRTAAIAGDSLLRTMVGAADRAKAGDQQAMLSVVANHIGMTLGAQKGARINQAVWNEATESAPWLQNVQKAWGSDGYLQGVKLSPQQVDQMVELGKLRRDVMWEQASQTAQAAGVPLQVPQFQLHPTGAPAPKAATGGNAPPAQGGAKKKWSKSKWASANPGKDVNAAAKQAESQGREVVD
jgi:hypothetical protein